MNTLTRNLLLAAIMMAFSGTTLANDPPAAKDAKKEEAKPDESNLPSKPYPKNAAPKAFSPKKEEKQEAAGKPEPVAAAPALAEKHDDKHGDKHAEKPAEKHAAAEKHDTGHDKPVVMAAPRMRKLARAATPAPMRVVNPALMQMAGESTRMIGGDRDPYVAQSNDTLDKVIKKTFPNTPFSMEIMREAFVRANPQLVPPVKNVKLRAGQLVQLPDVNMMRMVVMGEGGGASTLAVSGDVHYEKKPAMFMPSPTAPTAVVPVAAAQNPPVAIPRLPVNVASNSPTQEASAEEKKKWIRYP